MSKIIITRPVIQPDYDVRLPMSKSIVNRMLILEPGRVLPLIAAGEDRLCDDLRVMANAVRSVNGKRDERHPVTIDLHGSGTAMRFITALCAVTEGEWLLTGSDRLCERPIGPLVDALRSVGAEIKYNGEDGYPPLTITCRETPRGGHVEIDGSESSQYVSALMLVADRFCDGLDIYIKGEPASMPYIDMTRRLIDDHRCGKTLETEPDWSATAFWLEIKLLMKRFTNLDPEGIRLEGLKDESIQGDRVAMRIFEELDRCEGVFEWDFRNCPDLVQPVAVACCMVGRPFRFTGVRNLRLKETDRLTALKVELGKMGAVIDIGEDEIRMGEKVGESRGEGREGSREESRGEGREGSMGESRGEGLAENRQERGLGLGAVETYGDHRMAMAFAGCALKMGKVVINEPEVVEKSYPGFWEELRAAGFGVEYQPSMADTGEGRNS